MNMRMMVSFFVIVVMSIFLVACEDSTHSESGTDSQARQTEQMHTEAVRQVGMPELTNFQELQFAKTITEMRDTAITTYTYMVDMNGNRHFICQSIGFGLPYSTQMTSPSRRAYTGNHDGDSGWREATMIAMPQPEPNGLYLPDNVAATWIICDDGDGGIQPVYSEPALLVSPFPMHDLN